MNGLSLGFVGGGRVSSISAIWSERSMRRLFAILVIVGLLFAGLFVLFPGRATAATTRHGGWADSIVWSLQGDGSLATQAMDAGTMNMWLYFYSTQAQLQAAQSDPNL